MPFALFGLAVAWVVMLLFGGAELDRELMMLLYAGDREHWVVPTRVVTEFGGWLVLVPLTLIGALILGLRNEMRAAFLLLAVTFSGRVFVELQKHLTARLRPDEHEHFVEVQSLAFPSGHAANATIVYVTLALLLTTGRTARSLALWGAVWLALAVGASRVVLGVHWPTDVIGGWAFGLFWTFLLLGLARAPLDDGTPRPVRHSPWQGGRT